MLKEQTTDLNQWLISLLVSSCLELPAHHYLLPLLSANELYKLHVCIHGFGLFYQNDISAISDTSSINQYHRNLDRREVYALDALINHMFIHIHFLVSSTSSIFIFLLSHPLCSFVPLLLTVGGRPMSSKNEQDCVPELCPLLKFCSFFKIYVLKCLKMLVKVITEFLQPAE